MTFGLTGELAGSCPPGTLGGTVTARLADLCGPGCRGCGNRTLTEIDAAGNPTGRVMHATANAWTAEIAADGTWTIAAECIPCLDQWITPDGIAASETFAIVVTARPTVDGTPSCSLQWLVFADCTGCVADGTVHPITTVGAPLT